MSLICDRQSVTGQYDFSHLVQNHLTGAHQEVRRQMSDFERREAFENWASAVRTSIELAKLEALEEEYAVNEESINEALKRLPLIIINWQMFVEKNPRFAENKPFFDAEGRLIFTWQFGRTYLSLVFAPGGGSKMLSASSADPSIRTTLL